MLRTDEVPEEPNPLDEAAIREQNAARVKRAQDVSLPEQKYFEGDFKRHQRKGVAWLYFTERALLADTVGLGKTIEALGLLALLKQRRELTGRAIIVVRPPALLQWFDECEKFTPRLTVEVAIGNRRQRLQRYASNWDVLLIGYQMFLREAETLMRLDPAVLIVDDVDPLRNSENQTARMIKRMARQPSIQRVIVMSGTPIQTRLHELYSLLEPMGIRSLLGSEASFRRRYVREEPITVFSHRTGRRVTQRKIVGYKNMEEFKRLIEPFYLRRTHRDLEDEDLPQIMTENVWLELSQPQRLKYAELQRGVLRLLTEEGEQVKRATALSKILYGAQICSGLVSVGEPDIPGHNACKLDWLMDKLTGDLVEEKVVVFCQFKNTIRAVHARLREAEIGFSTIWGDEPDAVHRQAEQRRFWEDPSCRVMLGTSAMEQSLNLQVSNVLINVDTLLNPARMMQLVGRIRRLGSAHAHVWVFNLLTRDTQEERYLPVLEQRSALADYVWGEATELYDQLSPMQLLQLIRP